MIICDEILIEMVYKEMGSDKIVYVIISIFLEIIYDEFEKVLKFFEKDGMKGFVFDLWGNFGGLFD